MLAILSCLDLSAKPPERRRELISLVGLIIIYIKTVQVSSSSFLPFYNLQRVGNSVVFFQHVFFHFYPTIITFESVMTFLQMLFLIILSMKDWKEIL
jgi:hypothetical protein